MKKLRITLHGPVLSCNETTNSIQQEDYSRDGVLAGLISTSSPNLVDERRLRAGAAVFYAKSIKKITLQRVLCSKIAFEVDKVVWTEVLVLYDNMLWCQDESSRNKTFQQTFGDDLERLTLLLKAGNFTQTNFKTNLKALSRRIQEQLPNFLIPHRNLSTVEKHIVGKYSVRPTKESGVPTRELPPVKVIGRGYRDKGTYRDTAWDGSPGWKEVATYFERMNDEK